MVSELKETYFDLIIIGGGITGAGIALDAASRGLKVALIEKNDFASGTSSKSTKLIHGGLRYLKQFDIGLVHETGTERAIVHHLAPHLVIPEKMIIPIMKNGKHGKFFTSIGLMIYDFLAHVHGKDKRKMLNRKEALQLEPLLPEDRTKGAGFYAEYRTDDSRLTIENIKTALKFDATALNYTEVTAFNYENDTVSGVKVKDYILHNEYTINAKYIVNASGPWVDDLRKLDEVNGAKELHLTKGVHLVFQHEKIPVKHAIYFDAPDGRMIFAIPRGKVTYVGTTDTNFNGDKDHIEVNTSDIKYLIDAINFMFTTVKVSKEDVISSWAGIRPLINEKGKSPSELSRKDEIFESASGLISIAGGKLTGYRKMAERVVNRVAKKIRNDGEQKVPGCTTKNILLTGGPWADDSEVQSYTQELYDRLLNDGFSLSDITYLVNTYGKQTEEILKYYDAITDHTPQERMLRSEVHFCIQYELIYNPMDFLARRTGRLYFDTESVLHYKDVVLQVCNIVFNYPENIYEHYKTDMESII